jgi:hypothetical protein
MVARSFVEQGIHELGWVEQALLGMAPAYQGLHLERGLRGQRHDRLIVDFELVVQQRGFEAMQQFGMTGHFLAHGIGEEFGLRPLAFAL